MTLLLSREDVQIHHASWSELAAALPRREDGTACDALIVDAPYSERTHAGHDAGIASKTWTRPSGGVDRAPKRRTLSYASWSPDDVAAFVVYWAPLTRGWLVTITDDVLAPAWADALRAAGRYVFAPLPFVAPGSRVRLTGDGPSNWTCWLVVARPSRPPYSRWGTLQGAYVLPPGCSEDMPVVGGKPLWLMERLVEDYSRPGDVVCDPCCGAGTAVLAASRTGRIGIGGDVSREHAELAAKRCGGMRQAPLFVAGVGT